MGRYYYIKGDDGFKKTGKFGFGNQPSTDPEFFGAYELFIHYHIEDIESVENGLKECRKHLKGHMKKIKKYLNDNGGRIISKGTGNSDSQYLHEYLGIDKDKEEVLMLWYDRYKLGKEIKRCLKTNDECRIEAEL